MTDKPKLKIFFVCTNYPEQRLNRTVYCKEGEFFKSQGGMKDAWGKTWTPVYATDLDHAKHIAQDPDFKFGGRHAKPFNKNGRWKPKVPYHGWTHAQNEAWERRYLR